MEILPRNSLADLSAGGLYDCLKHSLERSGLMFRPIGHHCGAGHTFPEHMPDGDGVQTGPEQNWLLLQRKNGKVGG